MPSFLYGREARPTKVRETKKDCFAYKTVGRGRERCNCLIEMVCKNKECRFYKTEREHRLGLKHTGTY